MNVCYFSFHRLLVFPSHPLVGVMNCHPNGDSIWCAWFTFESNGNNDGISYSFLSNITVGGIFTFISIIVSLAWLVTLESSVLSASPNINFCAKKESLKIVFFFFSHSVYSRGRKLQAYESKITEHDIFLQVLKWMNALMRINKERWKLWEKIVDSKWNMQYQKQYFLFTVI